MDNFFFLHGKSVSLPRKFAFSRTIPMPGIENYGMVILSLKTEKGWFSFANSLLKLKSMENRHPLQILSCNWKMRKAESPLQILSCNWKKRTDESPLQILSCNWKMRTANTPLQILSCKVKSEEGWMSLLSNENTVSGPGLAGTVRTMYQGLCQIYFTGFSKLWNQNFQKTGKVFVRIKLQVQQNRFYLTVSSWSHLYHLICIDIWRTWLNFYQNCC